MLAYLFVELKYRLRANSADYSNDTTANHSDLPHHIHAKLTGAEEIPRGRRYLQAPLTNICCYYFLTFVGSVFVCRP